MTSPASSSASLSASWLRPSRTRCRPRWRAIRGRLALDVHQFAALVGLPPGMIDACERGAVAFAALPDALVDRVDHIDLLALADLDRACRPPVIRAG